MIERLLFVASTNKRLEMLVSTGRLTRGLVARFVAGTTLDGAIAVTRELKARNIDVSLDLLGETVDDLAESATATTAYIEAVRAIAEHRLGATVSVKLSQLGIGLDPAVCAGHRGGRRAGRGRHGAQLGGPGDAGAGTPWPTLIHKSSAISTYGLPGGRDAGFRGQKIAEFAAGRPIAPAAAQDGVVDPANRARLVDHVRQYLPGLVPEPYAEATCLFTSTPSEDFLIDGVDGITLVSPCSGHGAEFAPLVGELAADVATGDGPVPDRFAARARETARRG